MSRIQNPAWERIEELELKLPQQLRVYKVNLGEPAVLSNEEAALDAVELARADAFLMPYLRRRYIWCRLAAKAIVGAELGQAPQSVAFKVTKAGRPYVAAEKFDFNISHSEDVALVAVMTAAGSVGIDIEAIRPIADLPRVCETVFTRGERADLIHGGAIPLDAFYKLWTVKEACLKAFGTGFLLDPLSIDIDLRVPAKPVLRTAPPGPPLALKSFEHTPRFMGAIAFHLER